MLSQVECQMDPGGLHFGAPRADKGGRRRQILGGGQDLFTKGRHQFRRKQIPLASPAMSMKVFGFTV